jgi:uncharacterized protein (TIGR02001 family)
MLRGLFHGFVALIVSASAALSADAAPPPKKARPEAQAPSSFASRWDLEFGGSATSDFNYRGFSISNRRPSATVYVRPVYDGIYAGLQASTLDIPFDTPGVLDFHAGYRRLIGPVLFDVRANYYHFPNSVIPTTSIGTNIDYWEIQTRPVWAVNDHLVLIGHAAYAPDFINSGASETWVSGAVVVKDTIKPMPGWLAYASGELGHHRFGISDRGVDLPDFSAWNIGAGLVYKHITFDLRYYDSNLSKEECAVLTGDLGATPGGVPSAVNPFGLRSNWCSASIVGKMAFAASLAKL